MGLLFDCDKLASEKPLSHGLVVFVVFVSGSIVDPMENNIRYDRCQRKAFDAFEGVERLTDVLPVEPRDWYAAKTIESL